MSGFLVGHSGEEDVEDARRVRFPSYSEKPILIVFDEITADRDGGVSEVPLLFHLCRRSTELMASAGEIAIRFG